MENVVSMSGAHAGAVSNSVWCIPSVESAKDGITEFVMLVMTKYGPSYVPTSVTVPAELMPNRGKYREVPMSEREIDLHQSILDWLVKIPKERVERAFEQANNASAAARFVPLSSVQLKPAKTPLAVSDVYWGMRAIATGGRNLKYQAYVVGDGVMTDDTIEVVLAGGIDAYWKHAFVPLTCLESPLLRVR